MKYPTGKMIAASLLFLCVFSFNGVAQTPFSTTDLKSQLVAEWQRAKAYTQEYLNAMPADKYTFRPNDSVRTFAQQMFHIAQANTFFIGNGTGSQRNIGGQDLERRSSAQTKDSVVYFVNASYDYAIDAIGKMDAARFTENVKFRNFDISRLMWIMKGFEHQTHHRGQTTMYIRALGIRPPAERLF